ncbi:MAG: hypothetical protein ACQESC_00560 [Nanobdellota archaeon]
MILKGESFDMKDEAYSKLSEKVSEKFSKEFDENTSSDTSSISGNDEPQQVNNFTTINTTQDSAEPAQNDSSKPQGTTNDSEQQQSDNSYLEKEEQSLYQKVKNKISKLRKNQDRQIKTNEAILNFFTGGISHLVFWIAAIVDAILNLSGVLEFIPVIGTAMSTAIDTVEIFINIGLVVYFAIPTIILLRDVGAFFKIFIFYLIDTVTSFIPLVGDFIDAGYEFVVAGLIKKFSPLHVIRESYENKIEEIKAKVKSRFDKKVAGVKEGYQNSISKLKTAVAAGKKFRDNTFSSWNDIVFFLLLAVTFMLGPLGTGLISVEFKMINIMVIIVYALLLFTFHKFNIIDEKKIYPIVGFLVLNFLAGLLLSNSSAVQGFMGSASFLLYFIIIVGIILDLVWAYNPDKLVPIGLFFGLVIVLMFAGPQMVGYIQSGQLNSDVGSSQADVEAGLKNANPIQNFLNSIKRQYGYGNGSVVQGSETERTAEFIGAKIESVEPTRDYFFTGERVDIEIDTIANSYHPLELMTSCMVGSTPAKTVDPPYTELTGSKSSRVRCSFDGLQKGSHVVDVKQVFNYRSSVKVPLKILSKSQEEKFLTLANRAGDQYKPGEYIEGDSKSVSTSGPVKINVGNTREDNRYVLQMPIVVEGGPSSIRNRRINFVFQFEDLSSAEGNKITDINNININMPRGVALEECNFLTTQKIPYKSEDDRWVFEFEKEFQSWDQFRSISCDLKFDNAILNERFEDDGWFSDQMFFSMDYRYSLDHSTTVEVKA